MSSASHWDAVSDQELGLLRVSQYFEFSSSLCDIWVANPIEKVRRFMLRGTIATIVVASLAGCSLAAPTTKSIDIIPSEPNAEVFVNGNLVGMGPQTVELSTGSAHSVMAKCGRSAGTETINRRLSGTGVADIIGGLLILVPFLGLTADGAWTLSPETVTVGVPDGSDC